MKRSEKIAFTVTTLTSFVSGLALGLLLAPKSGRENRAWIAQNAEELSRWADEKSKDALVLSEKQLKHLADNIKHSLDDNLPDLYKATEHIDFKEEKNNSSDAG